MHQKNGVSCKRLYRPFRLKKLDDDGSFSGYGSVFGVKDSYDEVVVPGAFAKSLAEHKANETMPKMLWQHDWDHPVGVYTVMKEDDHGLFLEGKLLREEVQKAREAHALLKAGALDGLSIGYIPRAWRRNDEDKDILELTEVDLWEVSIVTFPANPAARVQEVRMAESIQSVREFERFLRDVGGYSRERAKRIALHGFAGQEARDEPTVAGADSKQLQELIASGDRLKQALSINR
jgi:HK97 family phage prohead protease